MIRRTFTVARDSLESARGSVVCRDASFVVNEASKSISIRRGTVVDDAVVATLSRIPSAQLDVVIADPGEIPQPDASRLVAEAIVGDGITVDPPHQGQCIVRARIDGLARTRGPRVTDINRLGAVLLSTALDGRIVRAGDTIAIIKASSLWVPDRDVRDVIAVAGNEPVFRVAPFSVRNVAFVAGERIRPRNFAAASDNMRSILKGFGADLTSVRHLTDGTLHIVDTFRQLLREGVEVILVAGSIMLDPGDPFIVALQSLDATITVQGAPIDPGTMFWVADLDQTTVLGLASCELYGRLSVLDLILPYALAKEPVTRDLLAELGYGGLLDQTFAARRA